MLASLIVATGLALPQEPEDLPILRPGETIEGEINYLDT